ncbi:MAG: hypothetical protein RIE08_00470 [Acidimicrobiales bacterium]
MAIDLETKDCTAVTDAELEEMAELSGEGTGGLSVGDLSKQTEFWVLSSTARENGRLRGFSFSTLERIGGTPAVIIGSGAVARTSRRDTVLRGLLGEQFRRALLAFPDEDVVVGLQLDRPDALDALGVLDDLVPREGHRANGEQRAWGKRLAKRYGSENGSYDERSFVLSGDGGASFLFDHEAVEATPTPGTVELFDRLDHDRGDTLVVCGWALAEDLERLGA